MSYKSDEIDRRAFLSGGTTGSKASPSRGEIASVLVQTRPEHLLAVEAAIGKTPFCEIHGRDPKGKLIVVIDAPSGGIAGATLNAISMTERVLSAALVFHAIDPGEVSPLDESP